MKHHRLTAARYAKALHAAARQAGTAEAVGQELDGAARLVTAERPLRDAFSRPWIKPAERRGLATAVAERAGASGLVRDFLGLVAERGRMALLSDIASVYRELVDEDQGRARARVRSVVPLTEDERRRLLARLSTAIGKDVVLEAEVDPALLGGFVAEIGSLTLDGSLDGQLARMRDRLTRG